MFTSSEIPVMHDHQLLHISQIHSSSKNRWNTVFSHQFYITIKNIMKALYQIPNRLYSIKASAFSTPDGHHEFIVMPQGI
ncbi:hypothetical protein AYI68_g7670 [Smittium mucronatum]|uniref:Uncharacterized protein n=1 Tax=Smittium mucronatum TaxID=133383 RepID=A0A1R0GN11_9FUNG|nr:hypothetical protein AYI68_g7670 [Smittium mucronatum]